MLFVVQNNRLAISTCTVGKTFFDTPAGRVETVFGMPIHRIDGRDVLEADAAFGRLVAEMRAMRGPAVAVLDVERLDSHTNADDQTRLPHRRRHSACRRNRRPRRAFTAAGC